MVWSSTLLWLIFLFIIDQWEYEKSHLTLNKLQQKSFQRILVVLGLLAQEDTKNLEILSSPNLWRFKRTYFYSLAFVLEKMEGINNTHLER